jgi:Ca-activated chloride channel homolog
MLAGGVTFAAGRAQGQDRGICPQCQVGANSRGPGADSDGSLPGDNDAVRSGAADSWTVRKRVDEVTVFFSATDGHKFVPGLNQENLRVSDDNKPVARISAFGYQRDLPLRLGLLVDTSSSVNRQFRDQQRAAVQFLHQVVRRGLDLAFVAGFANQSVVTQDYSDDPERLAAGVAALRNGGSTALFDAVSSACDKMTSATDAQPAARILIVLSDGDDNQSRTTLNQAIEKAQIREITIYTMNTSVNMSEPGVSPERRALKQLAVETGGRGFEQAGKREVIKAFAAIEEEMRNRYALSYQPSDLKEDGRFHRIQIAAEKSGRRFHVHTRRGYYARWLLPSTE